MAIKTRNIDPATPARYVVLEWSGPGTLPVVAAGTPNFVIGTYMFSELVKTQTAGTLPQFGKIVDVVFTQSVAGTGGTSWVFNIKKNGTTILATNCTLLPTAAANIAWDTKFELGSGAITGVTRPVLTSTQSSLLLKKGDTLSVDVTVTGVYTLNPSVSIHVVVDPFPV